LLLLLIPSFDGVPYLVQLLILQLPILQLNFLLLVKLVNPLYQFLLLIWVLEVHVDVTHSHLPQLHFQVIGVEEVVFQEGGILVIELSENLLYPQTLDLFVGILLHLGDLLLQCSVPDVLLNHLGCVELLSIIVVELMLD
jgi:hypothetical protein